MIQTMNRAEQNARGTAIQPAPLVADNDSNVRSGRRELVLAHAAQRALKILGKVFPFGDGALP